MGYGNISFVLDPEVKAAIKLKFDGLKADMPFLITLTSEERKKLRTIGPNRLSYVTEVNLTSNSHSPALAADFNLAEFNKDKTGYTDLAELRTWAEQLMESIDNTMMALGAELMKQTDTAYGYLKIHAKKTNDQNLDSAVKRIADMLKRAKTEEKK
jgi:hypothetical protein